MWNQLLQIGQKAVNETKWGLKQLDKKRDEIFGTDPRAVAAGQRLDQFVSNYTPIGLAEKGAVLLGGNVAETVGLPREAGEFVGGALAPGLAGPPKPPIKGLASAQRAATSIKIKDNLKGVVDDLTTPPTPPTPQLATAGAATNGLSIRPPAKPSTPSQVMKAVTIDNPTVTQVTGRKVGDEIIKNEDGLAKHLVERRSKIQRYENAIESAQEVKELEKLKVNPDPAVVKTANRSLKRNRPKLYSTQSNVKPFTPDDPQLYGKPSTLKTQNKHDWQKARQLQGKQISEKIHEHHLVTKGGSAAAFRKMEEFVAAGKADMDDLVVMYEYAAKKKAATGDRLSNNAYILDTPHSELHQQVLKPAGDEFTQKQWNSILKSTKTPDDLMKWWVDQVDNNYVPNKQTGQIWQDLDDLIKEIQSK